MCVCLFFSFYVCISYCKDVFRLFETLNELVYLANVIMYGHIFLNPLHITSHTQSQIIKVQCIFVQFFICIENGLKDTQFSFCYLIQARRCCVLKCNRSYQGKTIRYTNISNLNYRIEKKLLHTCLTQKNTEFSYYFFNKYLN